MRLFALVDLSLLQCETFLNDIQEKSVLEKFIQLEELFQLDEMIKEYPETDLQQFSSRNPQRNDPIHQNTQEYRYPYNLALLDKSNIFRYSKWLFLWGKAFILNSWVQEFLYNLSDTIKAFSILLLTDLCIGFHSPHGWELMIGYIYKDFGFAHYEQILSGLVSTFPVILDTIFKYWIFRYLNRVSPSLVGRDYSLHICLTHDIYNNLGIHFKCISNLPSRIYKNPREATGRIVCANCHLASKPVDIEVPQAVLPDTVFEAVVKIPYDMQLNNPPRRISPEMKEKIGNLLFRIYRPNKKNILVIGPVPGQKYSEITFPILAPDLLLIKISLLKISYIRENRGGVRFIRCSKIKFYATTKKGDTKTIVDASNERQVIDIIPRGLELLVSEGESIKLDQPLTSNPN
ncbi:LOW QUALITY PROTEIN: hypothetical protein HID58_096042, partial [Brassica napus]